MNSQEIFIASFKFDCNWRSRQTWLSIKIFNSWQLMERMLEIEVDFIFSRIECNSIFFEIFFFLRFDFIIVNVVNALATLLQFCRMKSDCKFEMNFCFHFILNIDFSLWYFFLLHFSSQGVKIEIREFAKIFFLLVLVPSGWFQWIGGGFWLKYDETFQNYR